jgi:hypothetical protein
MIAPAKKHNACEASLRLLRVSRCASKANASYRPAPGPVEYWSVEDADMETAVTQFVLIPQVPERDPQWLGGFVRQLMRMRPKLGRESAVHHSLHAFNAMFLLSPIEAAQLWDETMSAQLPSWAKLR